MAEAGSVLQVVRPAEGGMRRHVSLLASGLSERDWQVVVAAPDGFTTESANVPMHNVAIAARTQPLADLRAAAQLAAISRDFELLHAHGLRAAWIAAMASRMMKAPFVVTAHNLAPQSPGPAAKALLRWVFRRASSVITVSNAVAQSLAAYGVSPLQVAVIPNGVDLGPFDSPRDRYVVLSELGILASCKVIAAVGRLSPEKGFSTLIKAAPAVLERYVQVQLVIAGDGPERDNLTRLASELGLGERVHLIGRYPDIPGLLAAADLVVVPSLSEGQGIVALEAMAAGKPVVASRVGGLIETVNDGRTGILVNPAAPQELSAGICSLLDNAGLREQMGRAGSQRVEGAYSITQMIERTISIYSSLQTKRQ